MNRDPSAESPSSPPSKHHYGEQLLRVAFDEAVDAIILGTENGEFVDVNSRALELTGYSREELLRGSTGTLFSTTVNRQHPVPLEGIQGERALVNARMLRRKDGSQTPVEVNTKRLSDGHLLLTMRDVSDRLRLEEQLQLRRRMDSIGTLAGGIAHDFNDILAGIMGYTCLLAESAELANGAHASYVANVLQATQRAADLVHSLRSLAQPQVVEADSLDLFEVTNEVVQVLRGTTDQRITKESLIPRQACLVRGNASNLYHALMNLGVNAIQAIEQKGAGSGDRVTFSAEHCHIDAADPIGLPAGDYVRLTVADTGTGMSDEVRQHAFEPLFSTKSKGERKGQGLGLAMVYNIVVRQHGGAVDVETRPGDGCRFHLYLPCDGKPRHGTPSLPPAKDIERERILVVEDEPQVAKLIATVLERLGFEVLVAADGREAIVLFEREQHRIRLVLLDRSLPGLRGEQVFEHLMALRPDLQVVVSSGDAARAAESFPGAFRILEKPYAPSLLSEVVREALGPSAGE